MDFREEFALESVEMFWDPGFDSWNHFGVRGQPQAIIARPNGTGAAQWQGAFNLDDVVPWIERINSAES